MEKGLVEILTKFLERMERLMRMMILFTGITLVCIQLVFTQTYPRKLLTYVDNIEGQQLFNEQYKVAGTPLEIKEKFVTASPSIEAASETRLLVISLIDPLPSDKVVIYINGNKPQQLVNGEAALQLKDGDLIEIDCSKSDRILRFAIEIPHGNIEIPAQGRLVECRQNKISIGPIHFKN